MEMIDHILEELKTNFGENILEIEKTGNEDLSLTCKKELPKDDVKDRVNKAINNSLQQCKVSIDEKKTRFVGGDMIVLVDRRMISFSILEPGSPSIPSDRYEVLLSISSY